MSTNKRIEGAVDELGGKIKKGVGQAIGNEQMQAEGRAKELQGQGKQAAAKAAERAKGGFERVTGAIKHKAGEVLDNEQMEAEGKGRELIGEARQKANR